MTTLSEAPLAPLLDRLFADAEAKDATFRSSYGSMSPELRKDYRAFYGLARNAYLPVSPETGRLLYMLARAIGATSIVEFGTSFGISTLHLAAAIKDNGGGRVIGSEFEPGKIATATATSPRRASPVSSRSARAMRRRRWRATCPRRSTSSCSTGTSRSTQPC